MGNKCAYPRCTEMSDLVYLGKQLCDRHWTKICEMEISKAHSVLNIKESDIKHDVEKYIIGEKHE